MGYRIICTDEYEVDPANQLELKQNHLKQLQTGLEACKDTDTKILIERSIPIAQTDIALLDRCMKNNVQYFGCALNPNQDPALGQNTEMMTKKIGVCLNQIEEQIPGGVIVIVGYTLSGLQKHCMEFQQKKLQVAESLSMPTRVTSYASYFVIQDHDAYKTKQEKAFLTGRFDHNAFPLGLTLRDFTKKSSVDLIQTITFYVKQELQVKPPTEQNIDPKKSLKVAIESYKKFCANKDDSNAAKVAMTFFQTAIIACNAKGSQFDYYKSVALVNLGHMASYCNNFITAKKYYERVYQIRKQKYGAEHEKTKNVQKDIAKCDAKIETGQQDEKSTASKMISQLYQ